mgnify:CR=1 FL=1
MASRDPKRSHKPAVGQHRRKAISELTELGQFIETMFPGLNRWELGEKLGLREDVYGDMVLGGRTPSQRWIESLGWEAILSQSDVWQQDPATHAAKYKAIVGALPLQSPYEMEPATPGTLGEVFELAFPGYDRLHQAIALDVLKIRSEVNDEKARDFMRKIATNDTEASQQTLANLGFRIALERHCLQHGGTLLWHEVRDKYDAIAQERVKTRVTGGSKPIIQEWSAAVGEVFTRAQALSGLDTEIFAQRIGVNAATLAHSQGGGWFTQLDQFHDATKPFREKDHIRTREIYLGIAEQIYQRQLSAPQIGIEQINIMAALETLLPDVASAPYAKQRPGLRPAP